MYLYTHRLFHGLLPAMANLKAHVTFLSPIHAAQGTGDPHYRAVTGRHFDYHGEGEFLLMEIGPERSQLQGVLKKLGPYNYAWHISFAFGEPGNFAYQVRMAQLQFCVYRSAPKQCICKCNSFDNLMGSHSIACTRVAEKATDHFICSHLIM